MVMLSTKIAAATVASLVAFGSLTPSYAMGMPAAPAVAASVTGADVEQVQWRRPYGGYGGYRGYGGYHGGGYYGGGRGWYGGYRGYPYHRDGYRYYNGYWFPLAAFGAGAVIGGAIASQPRYVEPAPAAGINPRHYEWCADRYRSYRAYDNTFQPNNGPRQQCYSPYY